MGKIGWLLLAGEVFKTRAHFEAAEDDDELSISLIFQRHFHFLLLLSSPNLRETLVQLLCYQATRQYLVPC